MDKSKIRINSNKFIFCCLQKSCTGTHCCLKNGRRWWFYHLSDVASPGLVVMSLYTAVSLGSRWEDWLVSQNHFYINQKAAGDAFQKREDSPAVFVYRLYCGLWVVLIYGNLYTTTFCPHQRYFRRVDTRMFISIGFAIWSFIPASSAACLSSEKAFAVIATMGIFALWGSPILRIFLVAS